MPTTQPHRISRGRLGRAIACCTLVTVAGVGCSSGSSKAGQSADAAPTTAPVDTLAPPTVVTGKVATVKAIDNDFDAKHLQIKAGTTVRFINVGHNKHNIIPDDPKAANFSKSEDSFTHDASYTYDFTKPGTYTYYCSLHSTPTAGPMRGVITVTQ